MITIYGNEVELTFDNGHEFGYISFDIAADGTTTLTMNQGDCFSGNRIEQTLSDEEVIDLLEETLSKLRNKTRREGK